MRPSTHDNYMPSRDPRVDDTPMTDRTDARAREAAWEAWKIYWHLNSNPTTSSEQPCEENALHTALDAYKKALEPSITIVEWDQDEVRVRSEREAGLEAARKYCEERAWTDLSKRPLEIAEAALDAVDKARAEAVPEDVQKVRELLTRKHQSIASDFETLWTDEDVATIGDLIEALAAQVTELQEALSRPASEDVVERAERIISEIYEPAVNPRAPYAKVMSGKAARAVIAELGVGWTTITDDMKGMPQPHARYRVRRAGLEEFHGTPCYGMHHPWWVPRNGFTLSESEPIGMEPGDEWQPLPPPPTADEGDGT